MNPINHQHLYYFWTVAKEGSVAKACKRLHLAQPTISGQVIQFEKRLGRKLFERQRKQLILTPDGRLVMAYAEKIFGQTQEMLDALAGGVDTRTPIRIGVDEDVSKQAALKLVGFIQTLHPRLHIRVMDGDIPRLVRRLQRFSIDVALTTQGAVIGEETGLVHVEIARLEVLFVAAPAVARKVRAFPGDLTNVSLLIPAEGSPQWGNLQHFLTRHKIDPPTLMEIQDAGLLRQAALSGLGVAALSSIAVADDLREGALVRIGRAPTGIMKTLWLTTRKDYDPESLVAQLMANFRIPS